MYDQHAISFILYFQNEVTANLIRHLKFIYSSLYHFCLTFINFVIFDQVAIH